MMKLQGTIPVIALSFAEAKKLKESMLDITEYQTMVVRLKDKMSLLFNGFSYAFNSKGLSDDEKRKCGIICKNDPKKFTDLLFTESIQLLCRALISCHGVKPIIVLDEYDTPLQVAYVNGYWQELVSLMSSLFNTSFKTQNYYQCVLITGITRISKESLFSDVNNFNAFSVTSEQISVVSFLSFSVTSLLILITSAAMTAMFTFWSTAGAAGAAAAGAAAGAAFGASAGFSFGFVGSIM